MHTRRLSRTVSAAAWYAPRSSILYAWRAMDVCTWFTTDLVIEDTSISIMSMGVCAAIRRIPVSRPRMLFFQAVSSPRGHFSLPAASRSGKYPVGVLVESTQRGFKAPVKDLTCLRGLCGLPIVLMSRTDVIDYVIYVLLVQSITRMFFFFFFTIDTY
jgi:hypothetical protein